MHTDSTTDRQTHTVIVRQFRQFNGGRPTEKAVKTNEWDFRGKSSAAVNGKASARMISAGEGGGVREC